MFFLLFAFTLLLIAFIHVPVPRFQRALKEKIQALHHTDSAFIMDLMRASISTGASLPKALHAVDNALAEEKTPSHLDIVGKMLIFGASWKEAWAVAPRRFIPLRDALEPAWNDGSAPLPLLKRAAQSLRSQRARQSREAASKLGAKLVLPLGFCFLPAFIILGVIPVIAATGLRLFQ
ncbi:MAG: type II secretion system F family protein [Actinomycetaceae bacterium]|nr:type II secretion system F family protein [Actinomycetaceae bacterium]